MLCLGGGPKAPLIPSSWVHHVADNVHLSLTQDEAKARWTEKH